MSRWFTTWNTGTSGYPTATPATRKLWPSCAICSVFTPDYVIVTHRPQNDTRIAAAAWGRLLALNEPDAGQLHAFIVRYRERAPENIPG